MSIPVLGGTAGHTVSPCNTAGCYAPGGRYPLPSSVLMTAITARVAGVANVWVASPRPAQITIGAAFVAGADALVTVGGAQAIAALAYGIGRIPPCDVIVGPGNRWVTAAKSIVAGHCAIDMLAGPSECLVLADHTGNAEVRTLGAMFDERVLLWWWSFVKSSCVCSLSWLCLPVSPCATSAAGHRGGPPCTGRA